MRLFLWMGIAAAVPAVGWAQSSFTEAREHRATDDVAISACGDAVNREVRSRNAMASQVEVDEAHASPATESRTDIAGGGHLRDGSGGTRKFTFRCSYDIRAGNTSNVSVWL